VLGSAFDYDVQVILCDHCGAPIEGELHGTLASCSYCKATNRLRERSTAIEATGQSGSGGMAEADRIALLRQQDSQEKPRHTSVAKLLDAGKLNGSHAKEAMLAWTADRASLADMATPEVATRFYQLTTALAEHHGRLGDRMSQRAVLESALGLLPSARLRHNVKCALSRAACVTGDFQAAERWLSTCDPRSLDLECDSNYRLARAYHATATGQFAPVLEVLGRTESDVPIHDSMDPFAAVLRANALERLGDGPSAVAALGRWMIGPMGIRYGSVESLLAEHRAWNLCAHSYPVAEAQAQRAREAQKIREHHAGVAAVAVLGAPIAVAAGAAGVGVFVAIASVILVILMIVVFIVIGVSAALQ